MPYFLVVSYLYHMQHNADFLKKIEVSKKIFQEYHRCQHLDPDQAQQTSVRYDLGPYCLQSYVIQR